IKMPAPTVKFDPVNEGFYWGAYGEFKVLVMRDNGYINITKLCKIKDKHLPHWLETQSAKELIEELRSSVVITTELILIKQMKGLYETRGTYAHPDLVPHIASWISPTFALKVCRIVNAVLLKEQKDINARLTADIGEKDQTISRLESKLEQILSTAQSHVDDKKDLKNSLDNITEELSNVRLDNEVTHEMLEQTNETLLEVVEDRVVKTFSLGTLNTVAIFEDKDLKTKKSQFHIFRTQRRNLSAALRKYLKIHPNATEFYRVEYNPNAINYYIRIKERYDSREIKTSRNDFELLGDTTPEMLLSFIQEIENEKRVI
ncbi:hypothetical protein BGX26_006719, partial [Mortierella sp. AD094]